MTTITKTSMMQLLTTIPSGKSIDIATWQNQVVGHALVAIFKRQTADEKTSNATSHLNNIGFAGCDAKLGGISAKTFIKHGKLMDFQLDVWMRAGHNGFPRIAKYHRQLNEIAAEKAAKR